MLLVTCMHSPFCQFSPNSHLKWLNLKMLHVTNNSRPQNMSLKLQLQMQNFMMANFPCVTVFLRLTRIPVSNSVPIHHMDLISSGKLLAL